MVQLLQMMKNEKKEEVNPDQAKRHYRHHGQHGRNLQDEIAQVVATSCPSSRLSSYHGYYCRLSLDRTTNRLELTIQPKEKINNNNKNITNNNKTIPATKRRGKAFDPPDSPPLVYVRRTMIRDSLSFCFKLSAPFCVATGGTGTGKLDAPQIEVIGTPLVAWDFSTTK